MIYDSSILSSHIFRKIFIQVLTTNITLVIRFEFKNCKTVKCKKVIHDKKESKLITTMKILITITSAYIFYSTYIVGMYMHQDSVYIT